MRTNTYVVVRRYSRLSLDAMKGSTLPPEEETYMFEVVLPLLEPEESNAMLGLERDAQLQLLSRFRQFSELLREASAKCPRLRNELDRYRGLFLRGVLKEDDEALSQVHQVLFAPVEELLKRLVYLSIDQEYYETVRHDISIQKGRSLDGLTYAERIKILCRAHKDRIAPQVKSKKLYDSLCALYEHTRGVRNAIAHNEWERIGMASYLAAISVYCRFLAEHCSAIDDGDG